MDLTSVLIAIGAGIALQILALAKSARSRKEATTQIDGTTQVLEKRLAEMDTKIDTMAREVKEVRAEVKDNGGNSLKDVVKVTRKEIQHLRDMVTDQTEIQNANTTIFMNESIQAPAFRLDRHGECIFANEHLVELLGLPYARIIGRGFLQVIGRNQRERLDFQEQLMDSVEGNVPFTCETYVRNDKSGETTRCEIRLQTFTSKTDPKAPLFHYGKVRTILD